MRAFHVIGIGVALAVAGCPTVQRHGVENTTAPRVATEPVPVARPIAGSTGRAPTIAPPDTEPTPPLRKVAPQVDAPPPGAGLLEPLHPELRKRAMLLYQRATERGIAFRFIHGFAPYKARRTMGPGGMANWHNFGLAFDLNLAHRKSLGDAKAHFETDAGMWQELGTIAVEVGLVWGGNWRSSYDPFHFEWHPGHDSVINRDDLQSFLKVAGKHAQKWRAVWGLFPGAENLPKDIVEPAPPEDAAPTRSNKPRKTKPKPRPKRR